MSITHLVIIITHDSYHHMSHMDRRDNYNYNIE